nr:PREDICTED: monoacylglycerol lipase ABHD12 isoform X1 [Bemisia tabaci]
MTSYSLVDPPRGDEASREQKKSDSSSGSSCRGCLKRWSLITLYVILTLLFLLFVVVPILWKTSYTMQRMFLFLNFVRYPYNVDLAKPSQAGIKGGMNFYIDTEDGARLGTWHILPQHLAEEGDKLSKLEKKDRFDEWVRNGDPVVLYMHGNSGTRAASHRVDLYEVFQKLNFHVVAVDYRTYADSIGEELSENTTVIDGKAVFKYFHQRVQNDRLFVWGHSLGTGVSSHFVSELEEEGILAAGLMLEAPFNNIRDEVREFPLTQMFRFLPYFDYCFLDSLADHGLYFASDKNLLKTTVPILILHAEDDTIIPLKLGKLLHEAVRKRGDKYISEMKTFPAKHHYGHKFICRAPELPELIENFKTASMNNFKNRIS